MVPVADCLCLFFFLLRRCENSKNILTSLISQILTTTPAERSFLKSPPVPPILSLSLSVIVTNTDHDIVHISWKYSTVNEGQYQVALEKETETNVGWLWSCMTIILFIILETGWGMTAWELGGYRELEITFICRICECVRKSSAFMYTYRSAYPHPSLHTHSCICARCIRYRKTWNNGL